MKNIILTFFIANALFWGLFPHEAHCQFINYFKTLTGFNLKCPDHIVHLFMGVIFFLLAIYVNNEKVIKSFI